MQRCGKPREASAHGSEHSGPSFVGSCHLLLFCGRFLAPLVSLHTFNRASICRRGMNSQKADLLHGCHPARGGAIATTVSQCCCVHSLQGYSSTVRVTVVYTPDSSCQTSQHSQESSPENAFGDTCWAVTETRGKEKAVESLTVFLGDQNG